MKNLKRIRSLRINNYLEEHGLYPVYEEYDECYYERTSQLLLLLDKFHVKYSCIPNKL